MTVLIRLASNRLAVHVAPERRWAAVSPKASAERHMPRVTSEILDVQPRLDVSQRGMG